MEPGGYSRDLGLDSEIDEKSKKDFQPCTNLLTYLVLENRHRKVG